MTFFSRQSVLVAPGHLPRVGSLLLLLMGPATLVAAACATGGASAREAAQKEKTERLSSALGESKLPQLARELLRARMGEHGAEMTFLMANVLLLNHEASQTFAEELAASPKLSRPGAGEADTLNAQIPPRFFDLQEQLGKRAEAVALAARQRNDVALAKTFGELGETCVACHSLYLSGGREDEVTAPPVD